MEPRNRFHALCPYFAMFPESFAERWITELTRPGDVVLDPFSGRGTTALSALLLGRRAVACDTNDVAYCLTRAKTSAPTLRGLKRRINNLENKYDPDTWRKEARQCDPFFHLAFSRRTLAQLLYLRRVVRWEKQSLDAMVASLVLGSLHGDNRPRSNYLSNQMPRTISTKPAYSLRFWQERGLRPPDRDVFAVLYKMAAFRYKTPPPSGEARVLHDDMRKLAWHKDTLPGPIRCVVTSPPYFNLTSFEEDQWLRRWFLGGPSHPTINRISPDDRHRFHDSYWRFISDIWRVLGQVMAPRSHVVIRIGSKRVDTDHLERMLTASSRFARRRVKLAGKEISKLKNRQTPAFRPGSTGCTVELDCRYYLP